MCVEPKKTWKSQSDSKEESTAGVDLLPDFKLHHKASVSKTVWNWHKNRYMDQWNTIEHPEINPQADGQVNCNKGGKKK